MKTERVFISPHFCLEILPSKFLPCKLTLWGEEVKMLASPNGLFGLANSVQKNEGGFLMKIIKKFKF